MTIQTRTVQARWIATIGQELVSSEVKDFIADASLRLVDYALRHPELRSPAPSEAEPYYAIYHGVIAPTRRVLVEMAMTLNAEGAPEGPVRIRREPEHLEAYLPIVSDDMSHSRLARIYRELAAWVYASGTPHISCPPREVYMAPIDAPAPGDRVGEVAYPFTPGVR